ncbi:uncharacterized protein TRIREDRAFT_105488 [Trichoderma reesei QM6a]|uniref:Predicted protein n=1 Tax=Hypocrea jecorina (strain QM6a) TaxID=431241 RepID=G0RET6_HYPJQ|nr:uncharacterized protein TRIREDRAFT_105488 [Trichoderma reesei QM6a]EGR50178.1 predicted protein [Trichoderma reesei QM6a]
MYHRPPPGLHRRPIFEPQCTHATMTRVYSPNLLCAHCHYPGPSGWLYQCTQDREDLIEHAVARGEFISMDQVGCQLAPLMGIRKGSAAAREDRLSFLSEINQEQLAQYRPDQVAHILRQRENLIIQQDKVHRAFLSLNAVANGEVLPTAAAGYSFHLLGQRPVVDANVLKNIGCRPVPLPQPSPTSSIHDSPASAMSVMDMLDTQINRGRLLWTRQGDEAEVEEYDADFDWTLAPATSSVASGFLRYSPGCENLGVIAEAAASSNFVPRQWTPPPSPANGMSDLGGKVIDTPSKRGPISQNGTPLSELTVLQTTENATGGHRREQSVDESPRGATPRSNTPLSDHSFPPSPLKVAHGVAMLEESVELGVPDVITQA